MGMHGHGVPPGFLNFLVPSQYLISYYNSALAIRQQYHYLVDMIKNLTKLGINERVSTILYYCTTLIQPSRFKRLASNLAVPVELKSSSWTLVSGGRAQKHCKSELEMKYLSPN